MLAFGIISFAMIASVGLLPVAMSTFQDSKRDIVRANIIQAISSQANLSPYDSLEGRFNRKVAEFDDEGMPLSAGDTRWIYKAEVTVLKSEKLPNADSISDSTKRLRIEIKDINHPGSMVKCILIANQGK